MTRERLASSVLSVSFLIRSSTKLTVLVQADLECLVQGVLTGRSLLLNEPKQPSPLAKKKRSSTTLDPLPGLGWIPFSTHFHGPWGLSCFLSLRGILRQPHPT